MTAPTRGRIDTPDVLGRNQLRYVIIGSGGMDLGALSCRTRNLRRFSSSAPGHQAQCVLNPLLVVEAAKGISGDNEKDKQ